MGRLLIDVGSSTIKVYERPDSESVRLLETKTLQFKEGFNPSSGISAANKDALLCYINELQQIAHSSTIKVYATALFRNLTQVARRRFVDEFFRDTLLYFNVVSHDLETHYLEMALAGMYEEAEPLLLINIGGGSTELVILQEGQVCARHSLDLGVMAVQERFPAINAVVSPYDTESVVNHIRRQLPVLDCNVQLAIYNGGELTYMRLAGYPLRSNNFFVDPEHPFSIAVNDFSRRNSEIFEQVTIGELERLMPSDPLWMHGARACSAIAQAVALHYGLKFIIPSDSNMVHGIVRRELRSAVLSGSFRKHFDYILQIKAQLVSQGTIILSPRFERPRDIVQGFTTFHGEEGLSTLELERYHLDMIDRADALIVCCPKGYVGASSLVEIGYAHSLDRRVIFTERPTEFILNRLPAEVGL